MMMRRKIEDRLKQWKEQSQGRTAIMVRGARRVGKSFAVEQFAKENYESYILIDFNRVGEDVKRLFDEAASDLGMFFAYLQAYFGVKLVERKSLIIFDEVQLFPRARALIKFLVQDNRYDYIETGSLISIRENVKDIVIPSEERAVDMFPLDFEEFLWARGNTEIYEVARVCFQEKKPMGQLLHRKMMGYFREYMIVGGMPQAVQEYINAKNFQEVDAIKRDILKLYAEDIERYGHGMNAKLGEIFQSIPAQLQQHWKKFQITMLGESARMREYQNAFFWLEQSYMVNMAYNTTEPNIGMGLTRDDSSRKCYMGDTGLLISHAFDEHALIDESVYKKILSDKLQFNEGMVFENVVAQMLRAAGHKLYYYTTNRAGAEGMEIDFLVAKSQVTSGHNILPIEVKSGKNYTLNSLKKYIEKYKNYTGRAYIVHTEDMRTEELEFTANSGKMIRHPVTYLPVYMTGEL